MSSTESCDDGVKKKMSDAERTELMKKMDKDLEEHFAMLDIPQKNGKLPPNVIFL